MKYLLFGTGDYYERYKKWFDKEDVLALLDNSRAKQGTFIDGIQVLAPRDGINLPFDIIIILSFYVKEMRSQLIQLGVQENKIYHFYDLHNLLYCDKIKKAVQYYGNANECIANNIRLEKKILLLSQDMTLGGPAIALLHAAEVLIRHGYQVVYASMLDGPLKEKLLDTGIPVIVDVNLQIETMKEVDWIQGFSMIICNTINFYVFLSERDRNIPVIWWLHDSDFFYDGVDREILRNLNRINLKVCSVGPVPEKAIRKFIPDLSVFRLLYGVSDTSMNSEKIEDLAPDKYDKDKVCFVTIGYIEARKGQDILIQAVQALPEEIRKRAIFYLIGQDSSVLAQQLKNEIKCMPEIIVTGSVDRKKIKGFLNNADMMICPSREDPMPTVATEAMMYNVPCIVSDKTGTAAYIQDGINGFVFHSEDVKELSNKIEWCVLNASKLNGMGIAAREIYEKYFSMKVFEQELMNIVATW